MKKLLLLVIVNSFIFAGWFGGGDSGGSGNSNDYTFDAKDIGRSDKNISTKKIGYDINVTVTCDKEFSGDVYTVIQENDKNISDVNKTTWDTETEKNVTLINITKTSKDAYIHIEWTSSDSGSSSGGGSLW